MKNIPSSRIVVLFVLALLTVGCRSSASASPTLIQPNTPSMPTVTHVLLSNTPLTSPSPLPVTATFTPLLPTVTSTIEPSPSATAQQNSTATIVTSSSAYLGQVPPGLTPQVFAPGVVSISSTVDYAGTFSPDGTEFYFTRSTGEHQNIYETHLVNGVWSEPAPVAFSAEYDAHEPHITYDNKTLYFGWFRPPPSGEKSTMPAGIWATDRTAGGWSSPRYVGEGMAVSSDRSGHIYVTNVKTRSIGRVTVTDGRFTDWEFINAGAHPCIAPDGSYLLYDRDGTHLYVRFRLADGKWSVAKDLTQHVLPVNAGIASISPDGKYLFYGYKGDLYWVSIELVTNLKDNP